jgi:hypothetical protein
MADEIDRANEYMEVITDIAIKNAAAEAKVAPNLSGKCTWCGEDVPDTRRWCSTDCRDEFAKHAK